MRIYNNPKIKKLQWLNQRRKLSLFVGAGLSESCGLFSWNKLIEELAYRAWDLKDITTLFSGDYLRIARSLRHKYGKNFETKIQEVLYSGSTQYSDLLLSIPDTGINRICTFNYDNLLEESFQICGIEYSSLTPNSRYSQLQYKPIIFHPHGFLNYSSDNTEIILSENEYHNLYSDPYCWSNLIQIHLLMNYSVLFVGVSLTDPNLRRILDATKKITEHEHFAIFRKKNNKFLDDSLTKDLKSFGVHPIYVDSHNCTYQIFEKIHRKDEPHKERKRRLKRLAKKSPPRKKVDDVRQILKNAKQRTDQSKD
jgi:NAD-dependent SIR2 family protein deacetylase